MKNKLFTIEDHLKESLKNKRFAKAWKESEAEYRLACQLIEARQKKNISQRELANKAKTTQAIISKIETMQANPSLFLLKRIALELDSKLVLGFK